MRMHRREMAQPLCFCGGTARHAQRAARYRRFLCGSGFLIHMYLPLMEGYTGSGSIRKEISE